MYAYMHVYIFIYVCVYMCKFLYYTCTATYTHIINLIDYDLCTLNSLG